MVCYGTASETRTEPENGQPSLSAAAATSEVKKKDIAQLSSRVYNSG